MPPDQTAGAEKPSGRAILAQPVSKYEALPWIAALGVFVLASDYLALGTSTLVMILFALSLDLLTGYAGIVTLGHALFFGIGAYAAGLIAQQGWNEPISGLVAAMMFTAIVGAALGIVLSQLRGMAIIMTSMALGLIAYEGAKSATWLTGGDNGLQGFVMAPVLGNSGGRSMVRPHICTRSLGCFSFSSPFGSSSSLPSGSHSKDCARTMGACN